MKLNLFNQIMIFFTMLEWLNLIFKIVGIENSLNKKIYLFYFFRFFIVFWDYLRF